MTKIQEIVDEFDEKFPLAGEIWVLERHKREVTDWLKTTLQEYEKELLEQQRKESYKRWDELSGRGVWEKEWRDELVKELEGMKVSSATSTLDDLNRIGIPKVPTHNRALSQAITKIKEKHE